MRVKYSAGLLALWSYISVALGAGKWEQCGGKDFKGASTCDVSGWTCQVQNPYYSQCLQGAGGDGGQGANSAQVENTGQGDMTGSASGNGTSSASGGGKAVSSGAGSALPASSAGAGSSPAAGVGAEGGNEASNKSATPSTGSTGTTSGGKGTEQGSGNTGSSGDSGSTRSAAALEDTFGDESDECEVEGDDASPESGPAAVKSFKQESPSQNQTTEPVDAQQGTTAEKATKGTKQPAEGSKLQLPSEEDGGVSSTNTTGQSLAGTEDPAQGGGGGSFQFLKSKEIQPANPPSPDKRAPNLATTTQYGPFTDPNGGSACGCKGLWQNGVPSQDGVDAADSGFTTAAPSASVYGESYMGEGCGTCFKLTNMGVPPCPSAACNVSPDHKGETVVVLTTNSCPAKGNEQWCTVPNKFGYMAHFDLAKTPVGWGNVVVSFEPSACPKQLIGPQAYDGSCESAKTRPQGPGGRSSTQTPEVS